MEKQIHKRKQLGGKIVSLLLMAALMFPTVVQFSHTFRMHDHPSCDDRSVHLHQEVPNCNICHFHFSTYTYQVTDMTVLVTVPFPKTGPASFPAVLFSSDRTNTQLRAPPLFS
jgi:hypothetical protein